MNKGNIAVITGASSGLGTEFVNKIVEKYDHITEIWLIARRYDRMAELKDKYPQKSFKIFSLDLSNEESFNTYKSALSEYKPNVGILINNSGFGKLGYFEDIPSEDETGMIDVNIRAMVAITHSTIEYMHAGSAILNVCSIASFIPNPRMAVYCSTKAFVLSFSKALREELKRKKINVLASCPGPMDTEFLSVANIPHGASELFDFCPRVSPAVMAEKSLEYAYKGKAVYTNKLIYKLYRLICKLLPHNWFMKKFTA